MTIQNEYTKEELETKLGLQLATPEEIKTMEDNHKTSKVRFHSILRKVNQDFYVLIYGFKKSTIHLGMVLSTAFDGVIWCWNLWYKAIAGYVFEDEDKEGYDRFSFHPEWKGNPWAMPVNFDEVLKQEESLKYVPCMESFLMGSFQNHIAKGIKILLKYPHQVEMLQKIGYPEFATNPSNLKKSPKEILNYIKYAKLTDGLIKPTDIQTISWNLKRNKKPTEAWSRSEIKSLSKLSKETNLNEKEALEVYKYLVVQSKKRGYYSDDRRGVSDYHIYEYKEYLKLRAGKGWSNEDHSARFPSDFEHAYSELEKERQAEVMARQEKEAQERRKKAEESFARFHKTIPNLAKKVSEINNLLNGSEYSVTQPYENEQFEALSDIFHNCVGHCGYFAKQNNGKCLIYAIKKDGEYYACLEVTDSEDKEHSPKIKQLYLEHNHECDKETRAMVNKTILPIVGNYFAQPSCN
jgi:hypothetical protein